MLRKCVYITGEPSEPLKKLLQFHIKQKTFLKRHSTLKKLQKEKKTTAIRPEDIEKKILLQLEDLKQEKRKIFDMIAANMKKKKERHERKRLEKEKQDAMQL